MTSDTLPQARPLPGAPSRPTPVRGHRRPWVVATGALLASLGALMVVWLVGAAGQREEVLVVRQQVPYGAVVSAEDLGVARVSLDPGIQSVSAADRGGVVGQAAATTLVPGTLLGPNMVEPVGEPRAGRVLVPLAVTSERMPAGGLRPGDRILAVDAGGPASPAGGGGFDAEGPATVRSVPATVVRVGPVDINGTVVVDVTVSSPDGPALAVASALGQVALVLQPMGG